MSGRRRYERFQPAQPWDGRLRVLRDVVLQVEPGGSLLAVGHAPGVAGEALHLDVTADDQRLELNVEVVESRPVIIDGGVRHRMRLRVLGTPSTPARGSALDA